MTIHIYTQTLAFQKKKKPKVLGSADKKRNPSPVPFALGGVSGAITTWAELST